MKLVTFSEEMAPHGVGDTRLVPDDVAIELERQHKISSAEPWPLQDAEVAQAPENRPRRGRPPKIRD